MPLLVRRGTSFKVAKSEHVLGLLNEGAFGETQVGKFATIYPTDDDDFEDLARLLIQATEGFDGPIIPSDVQLSSVVYKRFGSFSPRIERDKFGFLHPIIDLPDGSAGRDKYEVQRRPVEDDPGRGKNLVGPGY
ncbi:MAG TPA: hypothetical protein VFR05_01860, partial [Terriglobia bacterium]|nr:hypothetical protein [Terriglobia bacterium]